MTNGYKEESSPLPAGNSSSHFYSGDIFILLSVPYGGLYGVLLDASYM